MVKKLLYLMLILVSSAFAAESLGTTEIPQVIDPTLTLNDPTLIHNPDYSTFSIDCSICEDLSTYSESNLILIPDARSSSFQVALSNSSRNPVQYAPVIIEVNSSGTKNYFFVYTNSSGLARFDFSRYNTSCADFTVLYCYNFNNACSLSKCFTALGYAPDDPNIPTSGDLQIHPSGISRPTSPQVPNRLKSSLKTYRYCPPAPDLTNTVPAFCFPLVLILALLFGALHLSGRNPFMGFDLSTPRVGKHIKYTANQRNLYRIDTMSVANAAIKSAGAIRNPTVARQREKDAIRNPTVARQREKEEVRARGVLSGVLGSMQMGVQGARSGLATRTRQRASSAQSSAQTRGRGGTNIDVRREANQQARSSFASDLLRGSPLGRAVGSIVDSVTQRGPTITTGGRILAGFLAFLQFTPFAGLVYNLRITSDAFSVARNMTDALSGLRSTHASTDHQGYRYEIRFGEKGEPIITRSRLDSQGNPGSPERLQLNTIPVEVSRNFAGVVVPALERYNQSAAFHYHGSAEAAGERLLEQMSGVSRSTSSREETLSNNPQLRTLVGQLREAVESGNSAAVADVLLDARNRGTLAALEQYMPQGSLGSAMASAYGFRLNEIAATYSNQQATLLAAVSSNAALDANTLAYFQQSLTRGGDFLAQSTMGNSYSALASAYGANNLAQLQDRLQTATELTSARGDRSLAYAAALHAQSLNPSATTGDLAQLTSYHGINLDNNSLDINPTQIAEAREHLRFVNFTLGAFETSETGSADRFNDFNQVRSDIASLANREGSNVLMFERALSDAAVNNNYQTQNIAAFLHRAAQAQNEGDLHTVEVQFVLDQRRTGSEVGRRTDAITHMDREQFHQFVTAQIEAERTRFESDPSSASTHERSSTAIRTAWDSRQNALETQTEARSELTEAQAELTRLSNPNSQTSGVLNPQEQGARVVAAQARVDAATAQLNAANAQFTRADGEYCDAAARFFSRGITPNENPFDQYAQTHLSSTDFTRYVDLARANQGLFDQRTDSIREFNANYSQQMYIEQVGVERFYQRLENSGVEIPDNVRAAYIYLQESNTALSNASSQRDRSRLELEANNAETNLARQIATSSISGTTISEIGGFGREGTGGTQTPPFDPIAVTNAYVRDRYVAVIDDRANVLTGLAPNQMIDAIQQMRDAEDAAITRLRQNDSAANDPTHRVVYEDRLNYSRSEYEALKRSYNEYLSAQNNATQNPNDPDAIARRDSARENFVSGFQSHMQEFGTRSLAALDGPIRVSDDIDPVTRNNAILDSANAGTTALTTFLSGSSVDRRVRDAFYNVSSNVPISLGSDAMRTFTPPSSLTSNVPDFARLNGLGSTSMVPDDTTAQILASAARMRH